MSTRLCNSQKLGKFVMKGTFFSINYYYRSDADIDYARVLYSSSAKRLQGKCNYLCQKDNVFYKNGLTHIV
jgi:dGTP triphosphohydrolase